MIALLVHLLFPLSVWNLFCHLFIYLFKAFKWRCVQTGTQRVNRPKLKMRISCNENGYAGRGDSGSCSLLRVYFQISVIQNSFEMSSVSMKSLNSTVNWRGY